MSAATPSVKAVFDRALELDSSAEREAYLDAACAGFPDVRRQVDALLQALAGAGSFLESLAGRRNPDVPDPANATAGLGAAGPTGTFGAAPTQERPSSGFEPGLVIGGKYTLVEPIGEGGMGAVWRAKQTEPVKRFVAVKLIKAGMDSKQVLGRFEAERQALALMDHPNIATVLDGGVHDGRPFFVMELVKGVPITEYCDRHRLAPRQRLELFVPVCLAIQHAHQKGIIHRDIKPSNVLIALYDDKPVVKVIDFGVAKATGAALSEHTIDTGFGGVVGTPQYMSPEQATFNNLDIDTRSDVYALGVLLYELLAGSPPFARKELERRGLLEILRVVREEEPPRPSTKLSTADALPTISANRSTEPKKLTGLLRNELDWVVMKALEKDRARRYETANGFAADVLRYLSGEAVQAHPPSRTYRLKKFARRNKGRVLAAGLVLFALLAGIVGTTLGLIEARQQEQKARNETTEKEDARRVAADRADDRDRALGREQSALKRESERADELRHRLGISGLLLASSAYDSRGVGLAAERLEQVTADQRGWEWRYLKRQTRGGLFTLYEPMGDPMDEIACAAYSPDGERIVTGAVQLARHAGAARVWDARTGVPLFALKGLKEGVSWVAFSPDGTRIAAVAAPPVNDLFTIQKSLKIFDARTGEVQFEITDVGYGVRSALFTPDGEKLVTGGKRITVWDLRSRKALFELNAQDLEIDNQKVAQKERQALEMPHLEVAAMVLSRDGKRLFVGSESGAIQVWDAEKKAAPLLSLAGTRFMTPRAMLSISLSPDGTRLLTGYSDGSATVRNAESGAPLFDLKSRALPTIDKIPLAYTSGPRQRASYSPDGTRIVLAGGNGGGFEATVWDAKTGAELFALTGHTYQVTTATFSPDGTRILTGSGDGTAKVWDAHTGAHQYRVRSDQPDGSAAFSHDGTLAVVGGAQPQVWDLRTGAMVRELKGPRPRMRCAAFSRDGTRIATAGDGAETPGSATVWDARTGEPLLELRGLNQPVNDVSFSPDGARVVTVGIHLAESKTELKVWDAGTGALLLDLTQPAHNASVMGEKGGSVAFSPDGTRFVTGDVAHQIEPTVWDTKSGAILFRLQGLRGPVLYVAYSPDGKWIVAGSTDRTVRFWNAETGELQPLELRGHLGDVTSVAFSHDQTRIVTGAADRIVRVWDARTGAALLELKGLAGEVTRVAFSRDGTSIATVSVYGTKSEVVVWDTPPQPAATELVGSSGAIREAAFSPDGALLATCEFDYTVKVWDTKTGAILHDLSGLKNDVRVAEFTPDGTRIVTRAGGGQQVWDVRTGKELEGEVVPNVVPGEPVSADGRFILHASGPRVEIVSLKPDEAEVVRRRRDTQPDVARYRDGFEAARASKDQLVARFYLALLPAAQRPLCEAQLAEDRGQKEEAIALYRKALELDARNPDLLVTLGRLLLGAGKKDEGLALYLKAIEHEPLVAARVGVELRKAGQQEGAVACYRKALERAPRRVELHDGLAVILAGLGRGDEYLAELRKLVELDPKNHHRHAQLGSHLLATGKRKEAFACYMAADDLEPRYGYYSSVIGLYAWFGLDQELAATRSHLLAVAKSPDGSAKRDLAVLACCLKPNVDRAERDAALALARAALSAEKTIWTLQFLGMAEYRCGNFVAAADALRRSIDMAGQAGPGYEHTTITSGLYLGMALFQQGKKDEARAAATRAAVAMAPLPKEGEDLQITNPLLSPLVQWLAYKEAKALIGFGPAP